MQLKSLELLARSENRARAFLVRQSGQKNRRHCVRCGSAQVYGLRHHRYRCSRCRYTFHDFTGRWLDALNMRASQWLWVLKLFELGIGPRRMAAEIGISYPTAVKASQLIRCAIFNDFAASQNSEGQAMLGAVLATCGTGGAPANGRGARAAFGIVDSGRSVVTTALGGLTPRQLCEAGTAVVKRGAAHYSDRCEPFDAVIFTGNWDMTALRRGARQVIYTDTAEGFWNVLRAQLKAFRGVSARHFPFYLIELQFRYNHRGRQTLEQLAEYITRLVPKSLPDPIKVTAKKNWLLDRAQVAIARHRLGG